MERVKACGVLVVRLDPCPAFLLLRKDALRYDLPKGHLEDGESERECALRELGEETGLQPDDIALDEAFRHETTYQAPRHRGLERIEKHLVVFLARLVRERELRLTEHVGHEWVEWRPPHRIQLETIDGLLAHLEAHLATRGGRFPD
jgi:8-oxo-dGTP pyrophosphatase MutT (NUDIX family)